MIHEWFEVQRHCGTLQVTRQRGLHPLPESGHVLVQMISCGICGTDIRAMNGNKSIQGKKESYLIPGHEGVGRVLSVGHHVTTVQPGDVVVILPHVHLPANRLSGGMCLEAELNPICIGHGHTLHMGWDRDGCFADYIEVPIANVIPVPPEMLSLARKNSQALGDALFALVEPMACVLSAYKLIEDRQKTFRQPALRPGNALVIGCGPIGILHAIALLDQGFQVWLLDIQQKRVELARWCLAGRAHVLSGESEDAMFDLVMITASSAQAIRKGETLVKNNGVIYLFAGLNTAEQAATDREALFSYERLHRTARGLQVVSRDQYHEKSFAYLGHSGYFSSIIPAAITAVATHGSLLDRAITGVISGWASPRIESRLPGGIDWTTENGSPAIIQILQGIELRDRHCKLLVRLT